MRNSKVLQTVLLGIGVLSQTANAGLVGYYPFEGNANDASGHGNHGTLSATAPTVTASGHTGLAYQFGAGNTFITVPININPLVLPQVTFGAWVNADVNDTIRRGIISHDTGDFDRTLDVDERDIGEQWCMFLGLTDNGITCGGAVNIGQWVFLVARYNAASSTGQLTVNSTHFGPFPAIPGPGQSVTTIGRNPNFDSPFIGRIDDAFFFDEYLTDAQIDNIRQNGLNPVPEPATFVLCSAAIALALAKKFRRA